MGSDYTGTDECATNIAAKVGVVHDAADRLEDLEIEFIAKPCLGFVVIVNRVLKILLGCGMK